MTVLATGFAYVGGGLLGGLGGLVLVSTLGDVLFARPVLGDFELVEMGTALAVFCFLPYAFVRQVHVRVLFPFPEKWRRRLDWLTDGSFAVIATCLLWRMSIAFYQHLEAPFPTGTPILNIPLWVAYPLLLGSLALWSGLCFLGLWHKAVGLASPPEDKPPDTSPDRPPGAQRRPERLL